jgi:crotonobetainyl-CoA:carnitine CoA-transferase CaiB-like acyl-CoA transferase
VVYASISGYGQKGSWRNRMAYAPSIQAEAGFTINTHRQFGVGEEQRQTDALSHADVYSGLHATIAVLAALNHRNVTGEGQYVDIAMASVILSMNERVHYDLSEVDLGDEPPVLGATQTPFFTSPEGTQFVVPMSLVGTGTFDFYLKVMRRPDLAEDPRFLTPALRKQNLAALHDIVQKWILTFEDMASLDAQFDEAKLATGTVREIKDFVKTDWAQSWGATRSVSDRQGGDITIPGPPWHFSAHDETLPPQVPALQGEHNWEILREIGLTDDDIEQLYKLSALIGDPSAAPDVVVNEA